MREQKLGLLVLASDAHGGFGGISQYNRDILEAMSGFDAVGEVVVLARIITETQSRVPPKISYVKGASGGKARFTWEALRAGWGMRKLGLVYCAHINFAPLAWFLSRTLRCPVCLVVYGIDAWTPPSSPLVRRAVLKMDLLISISETTFERMASWCDIERIPKAVLPNAIDCSRYGAGEKNADLARKLGVNGKPVIMTFGRMVGQERYKGFDEVIDALPELRKRIPGLVYLAAGDGSDRPRLEAKVRAMELSDAVVFTGRVPEDLKMDYYRLADCFVMPSSGEGFGFVVLEALACGVPVVASSADGTREAVRNGELGALVHPLNRDDIVNEVVKALKKSPAVPAGLEFFSLENFSRRLHEALSRIVRL